MSDITVAKNGQATLTCEMPDDTYVGTWIQNGTTLENNDRITISQAGVEHTLVIKSTTKADEGTIKFTADKGGVELDFNLKVTEPPSVDPAEFAECGKSLGGITIGAPATLKVPFSGQEPIAVTWKFNGADLAEGDHYKVETTATLTTLVVDNFQNEDCGNYEVTLSNEHGELKIPVDVSLSDTPKVDYEVVEVPGETKEETTTVDIPATEPPAKPAGNIKFNSMSENKFSLGLITTATPTDVANYVVEKKAEDETNWTQCALFKPEDAKEVPIAGTKAGQRLTFRIKAVNECGESEGLESRAVSVQKPADPPVLDAAALEKIGSEIRLKAGKELKLKIPFKASPLPVAAWMKNGKKLAIKGRYTSKTDEKETSFAITNLNGEDSGDYQLSLKNKEGAGVHSFKLIVVDVPGQPQGPMEITDVSGSEMTLNWQAPRHDGGKPIVKYIVDKKLDGKDTKWAEVAKIEGDQLTYTVPQLKKGEKYCFRVRATNEEGEGKPLTSVATIASGPPGPPPVPEVMDVTSTKIVFKWQAPENDGGNEITGYSVEYRENGGDWMMVTSNHIDGFLATLTDLHEESTYELRVAGKNSAGKGKYTESPPVVAQDKPVAPELDDKVKATYSEPVALNAGEDLVLKLPITGIPRPQGSWTLGKDEIKDPRAKNSSEKGFVLFSLEDLKRSDSGTYNIVAENSEGKVNLAVNLKVSDVPTAVENLKIFKASSKGMTVGWQPPKDDGDSTITAYAIEVQCVEDEAHEWIKLNKVFPGEDLKSSYEVKKGNSYIFKVIAINMLGNSPALCTEAILADDKFKPPAAPAKPVVSDLTKATCVLTWTAPEDNGSPINGYLVETKRVGRRNWTKEKQGVLVEELTCLIKDLQKGCEYVFRVTADNEAGFGQPGAESDVTIPMDPIPPAPTPTDFKIDDMSDSTITFTWKDGEGLEREKLHGYVIQQLPEGKEKWVTCNRVPIRGNKAFITDFRTGEKFKFRISPLNDGGLGGFCEIEEVVEVRQMQILPVVELRGDAANDTVHVSAGGTLRLSAFVSGKPTPIIKWVKDKVDQERRGATRNQDGIAHLNVRYLAKEDSGTFTISATNKSGTTKKNVNVVVHDAPDPPINIKMGDIASDGTIKISWEPPACDGGSAIKHYCVQMSDAYLKFRTVQDKVTDTHCKVKDLRPGATYYFRIFAENEHGRGEYAQSHLLTVIQKLDPIYIQRPKFDRMDTSKPAGFSLMLKNLQIKERRSAKFTCAVIGRPEPEITWFKDNNKIKANNKYSMKNEVGVCSLLISNARARDCGKYRCEAKNPTGEATCEANLMVYPDM